MMQVRLRQKHTLRLKEKRCSLLDQWNGVTVKRGQDGTTIQTHLNWCGSQDHRMTADNALIEVRR